MDEKNIVKVIESLGKIISDLEFDIYMKNEEIKRLKKSVAEKDGDKNDLPV